MSAFYRSKYREPQWLWIVFLLLILRYWRALLILLAFSSLQAAPHFALWFGGILLALCVMAFIPHVRRVSYRFLRLSSDQGWWRGVRVSLYTMIGLILVCGGFIGAVSQSDAARIAVAVPTKEPQLATAASQTCVTLPTEELLVKETPCEQTFGPSTQPDAAPDPGDGGSE